MLHDDEVRIDVATACRLIEEQFAGYADEEIEAIDAGTENAVFRVGTVASARFPLRSRDPVTCADGLRREASAMNELVASCPVATPRPIGLGRPGHGYPMPWAIQSWVDGTTATPRSLARSPAFARDVAELIRSLREVKTRGRSFDGHGRGGDLRDHDEWMEVCFERSEALLDVPRLRRLWATLRVLPRPTRLTMSHKDLIPANVLVQDDRLVGILDGGGFGPADPALDLVAAWHLLERSERETLREYLGSDDKEWLRGAAWAFVQVMGLVWYYRRSRPEMADLGRSTLTRIVDDTA